MPAHDRPDFAHAPLETQLAEFVRLVHTNPVVTAILQRACELDAPDWYLAAGGLFQTVWNRQTGRDPQYEIRDYDLIYFDGDDLSYEAEDAVIRRAEALFADLPAPVEVRNQARVHLWFPDKFGVTCPPLTSSEHGVDSFAATSCCVALRVDADGSPRVYAPHGLADLFALVVRPNLLVDAAPTYRRKAARWQRAWPELRIVPWPPACG
jgi:hypothetical protein